MKGIVITSHGPMAQGILETSKLFFGEQPQMTARCLSAEDNPDEFLDTLKEAISEVDTGDGNCMARIVAEDMESDKVQVITGVNLAMVLQILAVREASDVSVEELLKSGNEGIADLKAVLKANM